MMLLDNGFCKTTFECHCFDASFISFVELVTSFWSFLTLDTVKRRALPLWIREALEKREKEKQKEIAKQQEVVSTSESSETTEVQEETDKTSLKQKSNKKVS